MVLEEKFLFLMYCVNGWHDVRRYRQGQTEGVVVAGEFSSKMIIQCTLEMRGIIV